MADAQHQRMMENVGKGILQVAMAEEKKLDAQLKGLDNLGMEIRDNAVLSCLYYAFYSR